MKEPPPSDPREARELESRQRFPGRTWGGNAPRSWAVLGAVFLGIVAVAAVVALAG